MFGSPAKSSPQTLLKISFLSRTWFGCFIKCFSSSNSLFDRLIFLSERVTQWSSRFMRKVSIKSATQARNIRVFLIDAWREALRRHENLRLPNYFEMYDIKRELETQTRHIDQIRANTGELDFASLYFPAILVLLSLILWRVW